MTAKRRALGRGFDALLDVESAAPPTVLPTDELRPNRFQPRSQFDGPAMAELVDSIRSQGIVQPVVVTPRAGGGYTIVAGERRWRAARQAGLTEVPVSVREVTGDRGLLEMALVENLQRTDLNPMEEAEAFERLQSEFGLTHDEVARRVGKSRSAVTNAVRLLGLPSEVQDLLRAGSLSAGQARPLLALGTAAEQIRWARRAVRGELTARQMESVGRGKKPGGGGSRRESDPDTRAAEEALTRRLQTKVAIRRSSRGGSLVLAFSSEDELIRLYDLLMSAKD